MQHKNKTNFAREHEVKRVDRVAQCVAPLHLSFAPKVGGIMELPRPSEGLDPDGEAKRCDAVQRVDRTVGDF